MSRRGSGGLRIVAGRWRGRRIEAPRGDRTRPAQDLHRESVGNALRRRLPGTRVLDLFGGSGALAFECLSRGAAFALVLEQAPQALAVIRANAEHLGATDEELLVVRGDAYQPPPLPGPFDVVLVAPPYPHFRTHREPLRRLLGRMATGTDRLLAAGGIVVVQSETGTFAGGGLPGLYVERERRYGRTSFCYLLEREDADG